MNDRTREGPAVAARREDPGHPADLAVADRAYLVRWGAKEICVASMACGAVAAGSLALGFTATAWWLLALVPAGGLWAFLVLFFRNPARSVPAGDGLLVSPADGVVWDVEEVEETEFIRGPALRIGIFLSIFDVHVNRSPLSAVVEWTRHREGRYHDARSPLAPEENESCTIALTAKERGAPPGCRIVVRQISGAIARRIVCPLRTGSRVARGGLIGMIKYGSRTELWVPRASGFDSRVAKGDRVRGGSTILGSFRRVDSAD